LRIGPLGLSDTVVTPRATIPPIPVDQVAFVAIHRVGKQGRGPPGFEAYRVHVAGGKHFLVHAESIGKGEAQGFLAQPLPEEDSPYERFIFYYRGVTRVEVLTRTGELVVKGGHATAEQVKQALAAREAPVGAILVEQERVTQEMVDAAAVIQQRRRLRIGDILVEGGLATRHDVDAAVSEQRRRRGMKVGDLLVEKGIITEAVLAKVLSEKFRIPLLDTGTCVVDPAALLAVPAESIERLGFLPIAIAEGSITVAISDPLATDVHQFLQFHLRGRRIVEVLTTKTELLKLMSEVAKTPRSLT